MIVSTPLGEYLRQGVSIHAYCEAPGCSHHVVLDLVAIVSRVGPDHPLDRMVMSLRCVACGQRRAGIRLAHRSA